MPYPYQITSLEQYHQDYKESVEHPGSFLGKCGAAFLLEEEVG